MLEYSLVELHMVIPYNTIEVKYRSDVKLKLSVTSLVTISLKDY